MNKLRTRYVLGWLLSISLSTSHAAPQEDWFKQPLERASITAADQTRDINALQEPLTLREAILLALRYNPTVTNAEIDRLIQKLNLRVTAWEYEWQAGIKGQANFTRNKVDGQRTDNINNSVLAPEVRRHFKTGTDVSVTVDDTFQDGLQQNPRLLLTIDQPILRGGGITVAGKALADAVNAESINRLMLENEIMQVIDMVTNDYIDLIQYNNRIATAERTLIDAEKTLKDNAARIKAGQLPRTMNITQAAQIESLKFQLVEVTNQQSRARQKLCQDLGLDPDTPIRVPVDIIVKQIPLPTEAEAIETALAKNIEFQIRKINLDKDEREVLVAKNNTLPSLNLQAQGSLGGGTDGGPDAGFAGWRSGRNHREYVGLSLQFPFNDQAAKAGLARARLQVEKDGNDLLTAKRQLMLMVKNLLSDLTSATKQIEIANRQVELKQQDYEVQLKKQQVGRGSSLDVTTSQNAVIEAKSNLISSKVQYMNAYSRLQNFLGQTLSYYEITIRY